MHAWLWERGAREDRYIRSYDIYSLESRSASGGTVTVYIDTWFVVECVPLSSIPQLLWPPATSRLNLHGQQASNYIQKSKTHGLQKPLMFFWSMTHQGTHVPEIGGTNMQCRGTWSCRQAQWIRPRVHWPTRAQCFAGFASGRGSSKRQKKEKRPQECTILKKSMSITSQSGVPPTYRTTPQRYIIYIPLPTLKQTSPVWGWIYSCLTSKHTCNPPCISGINWIACTEVGEIGSRCSVFPV